MVVVVGPKLEYIRPTSPFINSTFPWVTVHNNIIYSSIYSDEDCRLVLHLFQ